MENGNASNFIGVLRLPIGPLESFLEGLVEKSKGPAGTGPSDAEKANRRMSDIKLLPAAVIAPVIRGSVVIAISPIRPRTLTRAIPIEALSLPMPDDGVSATPVIVAIVPLRFD